MSNHFITTIAIVGLIAGAPACDGVLDVGDDGRRLGTISFDQDPIVIEAPEIVQRGQSFEVRIRTYGGGCITKGSTEVSVRGLSAALTPYDQHSGGTVCTADLRLFEHAATLRFEQSGVATITIRGLRRPEGDTITEDRVIIVK